MRLVKKAIAIVLGLAFFSNVCAALPDSNELSAYYGFGEMEIIKVDWDIKNLSIADFDGDGKNDIALVNNKKASIEIFIQKDSIGPNETAVIVDPEDIDINTLTSDSRFAKQSVAVSQKVFSFVSGDLNSDGIRDLAFYGEPEGLYVILQKKTEVESEKAKTLAWRTRKKIKIDDGLKTSNSLICADINNDGANDLILAAKDGVYIIIQKSDNTLAEPVKYPESARIFGVRIGDLNGDNINDLILITNDSEKQVHVRFGLATGQLGPQIRFFIEKPWAFKLHNIDGIPGDEILIIDSRTGRLICYKYAAQNEEETDWPIYFYPLKSGQETSKRDLVVADFDGDGLADVVISEPGSAELVLYKQSQGLGLAEPVKFPAFSDITSLSAADIDGDGKTELGILSIKEKVIGISRFEDERLSFPRPLPLSPEPVAMELSDIDNDGKIDCLYIFKDTNDIRYLSVLYDLAKVEKKGKRKKTAEPVKLSKLSSNPEGLKVVDVDQDGLKDVLIFVKYDDPILLRQEQKRKFVIIDSPKSQGSFIKEASVRSIAVADVDGKDGDELLVAQKNFARSLIFDRGKTWTVIDQYNAKSTENKISAVAAFDINGNHHGSLPNILLLDGQKGQLQILKAAEDKTYRFEKQINVGTWNSATNLKILFAKLLPGGSDNILLFDSEKFAIITPPDSNKTQNHLEQYLSYETKIKDGTYGNLVAGDINSDGKSDIIMVEYKRNHIEILALDSQNTLTAAMRFKLFEQKSYRDKKRSKSSVQPREMIIADVTGDGKDDLVTIIHDRIIIYPQD